VGNAQKSASLMRLQWKEKRLSLAVRVMDAAFAGLFVLLTQ